MIWSFQDKDYNNNNREKVEHQTELPAAPLIVSIETFSKGEWCGWHSSIKSVTKVQLGELPQNIFKIVQRAILFKHFFIPPELSKP